MRVQRPSAVRHDTTTSTAKLTLTIVGAVAEFEADIRRDRQRDVIERAKAKAKAVYHGRRPRIDAARIEALMATGMPPAAIAREMGIGRASVDRLMSVTGTA